MIRGAWYCTGGASSSDAGFDNAVGMTGTIGTVDASS